MGGEHADGGFLRRSACSVAAHAQGARPSSAGSISPARLRPASGAQCPQPPGRVEELLLAARAGIGGAPGVGLLDWVSRDGLETGPQVSLVCDSHILTRLIQ